MSPPPVYMLKEVLFWCEKFNCLFAHAFQEEHKRTAKIQEWRACCYVQPKKGRHLNQEQIWATIVHTSSFCEDQKNWFVMGMGLGQLLYQNVLVRQQGIV
jgi:hypothetical protein